MQLPTPGVVFGAALLVVLSAGAIAGAQAQDYPSRPVTLVLPFGAGSGIDPTARIVGDELGKALKQPIVIDYKPGANGAIAASAVARATPDGYTLFMTTVSTHSANPNLLKSIPYDPLKDFAAVARVGNLPFMLVIDPKIPAASVPEFIAYVKAHPGKLSYASSNAIGLVAGATLKRLADLDLVHVPYRNSPQAINDVMTGRLAMMFVDFVLGSPQVKAGNLRALAVTTRERSALAPRRSVDDGSRASGARPDPLERDFRAGADAQADRRAPERGAAADHRRSEDQGAAGGDRLRRLFEHARAELDAFVREDLAKWTKWVRDAGIQPE